MRAWYDDTRYAVFTSDGVQTDAVAPEASSSRKVQESSAAGSVDVDYLDVDDDLVVSWTNVFRDAQADIKLYHVFLGRCERYFCAITLYTLHILNYKKDCLKFYDILRRKF